MDGLTGSKQVVTLQGKQLGLLVEILLLNITNNPNTDMIEAKQAKDIATSRPGPRSLHVLTTWRHLATTRFAYGKGCMNKNTLVFRGRR